MHYFDGSIRKPILFFRALARAAGKRMTIRLGKHQAALIRRLQLEASAARRQATESREEWQSAERHMQEVLAAVALDGGVAEGTKYESITLARDADGDVLVVLEQATPTAG